MPTSTGITVPGTAGGNIVVSTGTGDYLALAQQMASALNTARSGGGVSVTTVTAGSFIPLTPTLKGTTSELVIVGAGGKATFVPAGSGWNYVVNVTSSPDTVTASNTQVLSGDQGATIFVSGTSSVAATGGNNYVGAGGSYLISTATGNDTIFAIGTGTVAPGAGANFVSVSGSAGAGNFVIAAGNGDTIRQGSGPVSVNVLGTNTTITGSSNAADTMTVTLGGTSNVLFAGQTQAAVTIMGGASTAGTGNVVAGGTSSAGNLSVLDIGDFAIISANADSVVSATVTGNKSQVNGGVGQLNVAASGANDTIGLSTGTANVTMNGSAGFLFGNTAGGGSATVLDASDNSRIVAG